MEIGVQNLMISVGVNSINVKGSSCILEKYNEESVSSVETHRKFPQKQQLALATMLQLDLRNISGYKLQFTF
jgi:hypothetical protein